MRRLMLSLLGGTFALLLAAGQAGASAVDPSTLIDGLDLAQAAAERAAELSDGEAPPGLETALAAIEAAIARHDGLPGGGPANAAEVLAAILEGEGAGEGTSTLATSFARIKENGRSAVAEANAEGGPGNSENAPGQDDEGAGNSEDAPGQSGDNDPPGLDGKDPPGLDGGEPPGQSKDEQAADDASSADTSVPDEDDFPGNSGSTPAATRPTRP